MNSMSFSWHDNSRRFQKDVHAIFGASNYHWINYSDDKMIETYINSQAKKKGTELHEIAAGLIKNKIKLPEAPLTFNMYVNDGILFDLRPEQQLYYSEWFYGTADTIGLEDGILRISDLKTGKTKPSLHQLEIYAAFWFLEYGLIPEDLERIELRIYHDNDIIVGYPGTEEIIPIMDKITTITKVLEKLKDREDESYG